MFFERRVEHQTNKIRVALTMFENFQRDGAKNFFVFVFGDVIFYFVNPIAFVDSPRLVFENGGVKLSFGIEIETGA